MLYCFETPDEGTSVDAKKLIQRLDCGDIDAKELILGVADLESKLATDLKAKGVQVFGVKNACVEAVKRINTELKIKE